MADVRTGTDKIKYEPRLCCFGRKEALKKISGLGRVEERYDLSKNTGTSLMRLPLAKPGTIQE